MSPLGLGWTHPYEIVLHQDAEGYTLRNGPDALVRFQFDAPDPWRSGGFELHVGKARLAVTNTAEQIAYEFLPSADPAPLLRIIDRNDNQITFEYGLLGGLSGIRDAFDRRIRFRTEGDLILSIDGAIEVPIRFGYDSRGRLVSTVFNNNEEHRFSYSGDLLVKYVNPDGAAYCAAYDPDGRAIATWGAEGFQRRYFSYDDANHCTRVIDSFGVPTIYRFDRLGREVAVTNALGHTREIVHAETGGVLARIDEVGRVVMSYACLNQQIVTTENGVSAIIKLSRASDILQITDGEGNSWDYYRDALGNLVGFRTPNANAWRFTLDPRGYSKEMEGPDGVRVRFATSEDGARLETVDDQNVRWIVQRDGIGRVIQVESNGVALSVQHSDRTEIITLPGGAKREYGYNWRGDLVRCMDGSGREWDFTYDPYGGPQKRIDPSGFIISYDSDREGRLLGAMNENGDRFENEYDILGRIVAQTGFDGARWGFRYDATGHLVETVRPEGVTVEIVTDDRGLICEERFSNGAPRLTARNNLGRIIRVQDECGSVDRLYDPEGHLIQETAGETKAQFEYAWHALPLSVQVGTRRVDFKYDPAGRLLEAQEGGEFRIQIEHDTAGRTKRTRYPGGVVLHEMYDQQSRLIVQEATADAAFLLRRQFEYDGAGRLLVRKDEGGPLFRFVHDSRGSLSEVLRSENSIRRYVYDGSGNLIQKNGVVFEVAPGNRMMNTSAGRYEYDAAGRPTRRGETSFEYDIFGRLVGVRKGDAVFCFHYDPLFRRTRKTGPGVDVQTVWASEYVMQHVSASGECLRYIYDPSTGALLALASGSEWYAVVTDDRRELTEVICLADQSVGWACDPLGFDWEIRRDELPFEVRIRGLGREWDRETGLIYQRMRYFVPDDARFLEPDPIGVSGAWNVYQFCWNQPFLYIDPLGMACPLSKAECDAIFNDIEARAQEVDKRWGDMNKAQSILPWSNAPPVGVGGSMGSVKSHLEEYERQQAALGRHLKRYYTGQCQTHEDAARKEAMKNHRQQESRKPVLDPRYTQPYPPQITWRGAAL